MLHCRTKSCQAHAPFVPIFCPPRIQKRDKNVQGIIQSRQGKLAEGLWLIRSQGAILETVRRASQTAPHWQTALDFRSRRLRPRPCCWWHPAVPSPSVFHRASVSAAWCERYSKSGSEVKGRPSGLSPGLSPGLSKPGLLEGGMFLPCFALWFALWRIVVLVLVFDDPMPRSSRYSFPSVPPAHRVPSLKANTLPAEVEDELKRLRALCRVLRERLDEETERAGALQRENETLRREATLVRLYEDVVERQQAEGGPPAFTKDRFAIPDEPPAGARLLYQMLPASFSVTAFFEHANRLRIDEDAARCCLLYFFGHGTVSRRDRADGEILLSKSDPA